MSVTIINSGSNEQEAEVRIKGEEPSMPRDFDFSE
jgi:hypothetical protein